MDDQIRLAEAMGWTRSASNAERTLPVRWEHPYYKYPTFTSEELAPISPLTDANDDYAVLEWLRNKWAEPIFQLIESQLCSFDPIDYNIGDYARVAIEILHESPRPVL